MISRRCTVGYHDIICFWVIWLEWLSWTLRGRFPWSAITVLQHQGCRFSRVSAFLITCRILPWSLLKWLLEMEITVTTNGLKQLLNAHHPMCVVLFLPCVNAWEPCTAAFQMIYTGAFWNAAHVEGEEFCLRCFCFFLTLFANTWSFERSWDRRISNVPQGWWGEGRRMGLGGRDWSAMIEWRSTLDGPNGLILLLSPMT